MEHYDVTIILEDERHQRIKDLSKRYKKFNGWNEQALMQFGVTAFPEILDCILDLLELKANEMDL